MTNLNDTPVPIVEIGFGATWQTPDDEIVWVDVTRFVHWRLAGVNADRGRHSPVEENTVGNLTLTLWDPDRRFDPFNQGSPYAGQLVPGVPIRVWAEIPFEPAVIGRVTEGNVGRITEDGRRRVLELEPTTPPMVVWRGFVTGWPRRYDEGVDAPLVPLTCYDGTDRLTRAQLPASVVEITTLASQPILYWPLTDSVGTEAVELIQGADGIYHQDIAGTRGALLPYAPAQAMKGSQPTPANPLGQRMIRPQALSLTDAVSVRCWFQFTEVPEDGAASLMLLQRPDEPTRLSNSGEPGLGVGIGMGSMVGWIGGQIIGAGAALFTSFTGPAATAGTDRDTHHLVCTVDATTDTLEVWIDGQNLTLTSPIEGVDMAAVLAAVRLAGAGWGVSVSSSESAPLAGRPIVGHFAIWDRVLTPEEIEVDYLAGVDPWGGDRPGERIGKVLDLVGWPVERRNIAQGYHQLGPASWDAGSSPIEHLRLVEATETGRLFVDRHGDVCFQDWLWSFVEEADPAITLGDGTPFIDVAVDLDDEWVRNIVSLSVQGGGTVSASDEGSIESFGAVSLSRDVAPRSVSSARWAAVWLLDLWRNPQPRVPSIDIDLGTLTAEDQITVLGADLGTRVALRLAEATGDPTELALIIEGVEHTIRSDEWSVRWFVAPAPAADPPWPDPDPMSRTVTGASDGGVVVATADSYADARQGDDTVDVESPATVVLVGQAEDGSDWVVAQTFARFDVTEWAELPGGGPDLFFGDVELVTRPTAAVVDVAGNAGILRSSNNTYSTARSGSSVTVFTTGTFFVGQYRDGLLYFIFESFIEFDLSGLDIANVASVELVGSVDGLADEPFDWDVEARARDYGPSLAAGDWVAGASLAGLTLVGTLTTPGQLGEAGFQVEAALVTAVESALAGDGKVRMVLASSRTRTGTAPDDGVAEFVSFDGLQLLVRTTSDQQFVIEARASTWGPTLDDSDFVPGDDISTLPLVATYQTDATTGEWVFTSEPGFYGLVVAAIETETPVEVVLVSSHQRTDDAPDTHDLVMLEPPKLRLVPKQEV